MTQTLAYVDGAPIDVVENDGVPRPERRRTHPYVHYDVEDGAPNAGDVLRLPGRHVGEMEAPDDPAGGDRNVRLRDRHAVTDRLGERALVVRLEKDPPGVRELSRRNLPGALYGQRPKLHGASDRTGHQPTGATTLARMEITDARWHIAGGYGMLATDLIAALAARGVVPEVTDRDDLDITNPAQVARGFANTDIVVNCAAFTAVDAAEENEALAYAINATGPKVIANACFEMGIRLIHISTDYVFAGDATSPYPEDAPLDPQGAYGRTKAAGERAVGASGADALIVRTAYLYGRGGPCFPRTIAKAGRDRGALQVVDDQVGQPTWTRDLADLIIRLVEADAPAGIYHGTSTGQASWYEFAREVVAADGQGDIVTPCSSSEYKRPAPRPAYSVLGHDALVRVGVAPIGDWRERWALAAPEVLADLT